MKKHLYLLIAAILVFGMCGPAFAAVKSKKNKKEKAAPAPEAVQAAQTSTATPAATTTPTAVTTPAPAEAAAPAASETPKVLVVYNDSASKDNHYAPTGWMGDFGDIKIKSDYAENPHSGKTCIKITYSGEMKQNAGWGGIYWQYPNGNWGTNKKGGLNLTGAKALTFWAKGEKGGEIISEFKMGGITGEYGDTDSKSIGPVTLTNKWEKYSINLVGADLTNVIGGYCFAASKDDNPNGFTIYLDDIQYEY
ncbi:MAG: hypothetical protein LHV68_10575 [Elusimicrobia bacterium]|nr:hypothetical protein [Candidatus Liberimonas magnetica]